MGVAFGQRWQRIWEPLTAAGPRVVRLFHGMLALVSLGAWLSLGVQLSTLVGEHGLLPASDFFERARSADSSFLELPTLFWLGHGETVLHLGIAVGVLLSIAALFGFATRLCFACNALLYLGYTIVCDTFTAFQWDNMLVEASVLAACLSRTKPSRLATLALQLLLFKLYFESGIAKWQSSIGDWHDGSAMRFYFETAPLPTWLAWYAHHMPAEIHRLESWASLVMELIVPFFVFGPRPLRMIALAYLTGFLVVDTATANYGFFTYLALCLHAFLLRDHDIERFWRVRSAAQVPAVMSPAQSPHILSVIGSVAFSAWCCMSIAGACLHFWPAASRVEPLVSAYQRWDPYRVANVYHLFGQITRERLEPEFQTLGGGTWNAHALRYKPGPVDRPPPFVAPHQPRVDFRLWFYGLSFTRGTPRFVRALVDRLCHGPEHVQGLFAAPLPDHPEAVRIVFHRYRFTTPEERAMTAAYWTREEIGASPPQLCD